MLSPALLKGPRWIAIGSLAAIASWMSPASAQSQATDKVAIVARGEYLAHVGRLQRDEHVPVQLCRGRPALCPYGRQSHSADSSVRPATRPGMARAIPGPGPVRPGAR